MLIAVLAGITGCRDDREALKKLEADPIVAIARGQIDALRHHDIADLMAEFPLTRRGPGMSDKLTAMANMFPQAEPERIDLVSFACNSKSGTPFHTPNVPARECLFQIGFLYSYSANWLWVTINFHIENDRLVPDDITIAPLHAPLEADPIASLKHISGFGISVALLAALNFIFTLATFAMTWRRPLPKWRWLWRFLVLWGAGCWIVSCQENSWEWHTFYGCLPVTVGELGTYQPLVLKLYVPVFAIAYWARHGIRRRRAEAGQARDIVDTFS